MLNHYKSGTRVTYFISMNSQDDFVILVKRHHQDSPRTSEKDTKKSLGCFLPEAPLEGLAVSVVLPVSLYTTALGGVEHDT